MIMKARNYVARILTTSPDPRTEQQQNTGEDEMEGGEKIGHELDVDVSLKEAKDRIEALEDIVWDCEDDLSYLDDKYERLLEEASDEKGYSREKKLRQAHDDRLEMERLRNRKEDAEDRVEAWRDIRELMIRSGGVSVDAGEVALEDIDTDVIRDEARGMKKDREKKRQERKEMKKSIKDALQKSRDEDLYSREREEAAALAGDSSVLEHDDQLRADFEEELEEEKR